MASRAYQPAPLDVILSALPSLPRPILARLVSRAIERLDEIDGDSDAEEHEVEDSFADLRHFGCGPGCSIGDPDYGIEDMPEGTLGLDC